MKHEISEIRAVISGDVQGVGFRYFARAIARQLGLCGTVKNLSDGTVELIAQGSKDQLSKLFELLDSNEGAGSITAIEKEMIQHRGKYQDFDIIF